MSTAGTNCVTTSKSANTSHPTRPEAQAQRPQVPQSTAGAGQGARELQSSGGLNSPRQRDWLWQRLTERGHLLNIGLDGFVDAL